METGTLKAALVMALLAVLAVAWLAPLPGVVRLSVTAVVVLFGPLAMNAIARERRTRDQHGHPHC